MLRWSPPDQVLGPRQLWCRGWSVGSRSLARRRTCGGDIFEFRDNDDNDDEEYDFGYRADDDDDKDNNEDDEGITNCCDMILMIKSTYLNADDNDGNHDNNDFVSIMSPHLLIETAICTNSTIASPRKYFVFNTNFDLN